MILSDTGLSLIKRFEGCKLDSYQDTAGVWTVGYGSTFQVHAGMCIDQAAADERLKSDAHIAEYGVNKFVTVPLSQNQFDALCAFTFNLGAGTLRNSTLLRKLNAGDFEGASAEFPKWCHAAGKELPGLVTRRAAERELFNRKEPT